MKVTFTTFQRYAISVTREELEVGQIHVIVNFLASGMKEELCEMSKQKVLEYKNRKEQSEQ